MSFPFWYKSLQDPITMFNNLKYQELQVIEDKYGKILERNYPEDYFKCDHLSNHFTEYERIKCKFGNYTTPYDTWLTIRKKMDIKNMTPYEQRELIYASTKECNTFNVTFCLWIINTLVGPNSKILDPSSGWGDRLIASIASNAELYDGFDPNKNLQKGYNKIIKTLNINTKISITYLPFEESILKNNFYDIALTSPPYFDLEKYGTNKGQSIIKNPTYTEWLNNFYKPYILKMIQAVKTNGFIVIYIEDITSNGIRYNMREFTILTVNESNLVKSHNRIGLKIGKSIRYALIWQKI